MSTSASSAAILSVVKHVTANKWAKAADRLTQINRHVQEAEAALVYEPGTTDLKSLEADILLLLATVRKVFAGSLDVAVDARGAGGGGRGGRVRRGRGGSGYFARPTTFGKRLDMIERMLLEAKYSSGFSSSAAVAWRDELLAYLHQGRRRMAFTNLFGHLTNEWTEFRFGELTASESPPEQRSAGGPTGGDEDEDKTAVSVGRKEMHEQRQVWEGHVTNERRTDTKRITDYLDDLFHSGPRHENRSGDEPTDLRAILLRNVRKTLSISCKEKMLVTTSIVKDAINGVLRSDQLTSEKRHAMLDIRNKENVLTEIADILNIDTHLSSINRWSWGENPIAVQMRKAINGKYRVYLDLELIDAILIQCIGQFVSVNVKKALAVAWASDVRDVWTQKPDEARTAAMQAQMEDFTTRKSSDSVHDLRQKTYERIFYTVQLPGSMGDVHDRYDDDDSSVDSWDDNHGLTDLIYGTASKFSLKTDILRVCSAEMAIHKLVHGKFCVLQSDFEWFGPSLPHSTLIAVMKYFHFPSELVHFFEAFISMRMRFDEDGKDGPVLTRKTGIPVSFQITDGVSELLLFALDFAVNQETGGAHLYRNHDDLWFWGQPDKCSIAWKTMRRFADLMGLQLNKEKTGSAYAVDESNPRYVAADQDSLASLPSGKVKWGFLLYDPREWTWVVNTPAIEQHMNELRYQLKSRTAVMAHIQAYNAYIENFLPNNFGHVVVGLGDSHATMVLEALQYAQQCLYGTGDASGKKGQTQPASVAQHVRKMIQDRFGKNHQYEVPDCFLYMDVDSGGLGLANPVPAFAQYINIVKDEEHHDDDEEKLPPMESALQKMKKQLSEVYRADSTSFSKRLHKKRQKQQKQLRGKHASRPLSEDAETDGDAQLSEADVSQFMSFGEYVATSEEHSRAVCELYKTLLSPPVRDQDQPRSDAKYWASATFHAELKELFGGSIAEEEFLSLGLYRALAEEKVRWDG